MKIEQTSQGVRDMEDLALAPPPGAARVGKDGKPVDPLTVLNPEGLQEMQNDFDFEGFDFHSLYKKLEQQQQ